ncbi:hypothetical protein BC827DRAFT_1206471, partial [Russula dissimulans]
PAFRALREFLGPFLIDKTALIESIVNRGFGEVDLVLRPRRCGKSAMLDMIRSFFSFQEPDQKALFDGLHIGAKRNICEQHMGKYAVIFLDFRRLRAPDWETMLEAFQEQVSELYRDWETYFKLHGGLDEIEHGHYQSIIHRKASFHEYALALMKLSKLLTQKSGRKVIVLIDEYETPISSAFEFGYLEKAEEYFGRKVLSILLKLRCLPYSALTVPQSHPLHRPDSIYAGMVMFTTEDVEKLIRLSNSTLKFEILEEHYNSYLAASKISVFNPVSICSALAANTISNYWISSGEHPLIRRHIGSLSDETTESLTILLSLKEINTDCIDDIFLACVNGPVSDFVDRWPSFMQSSLHPRLVAKDRRAASQKTPERVYHVFLLGLLCRRPPIGWNVDVEPECRAGLGFVDIRITSTQRRSAVLIELKSSDKSQFLARDATRALEQIVSQNYRNPDQLNGILHLREYVIASFHLESVVKGRYLTRSASRWVEGDDPAVIGGSGKK